MGAGKYRKRPIVAECMQIDDGIEPWHEHMGSVEEVAEWCGGEVEDKNGEKRVMIPTMHGQIPAYPGEWVVHGIIDCYPLKKHQFPQAYDKVSDDTPAAADVAAGVTRLIQGGAR